MEKQTPRGKYFNVFLIVAAILIVVYIVDCSAQNRKIEQAEAAVKARKLVLAEKFILIEKQHVRGTDKASVDVLLLGKQTEEELNELAVFIKKKYYSFCSTVYIGYRLRGCDAKGYWATTHYTPYLEVKILGK